MAKKTKGNLLESLLRYEIVLALFTLIGVYYFLTFSPVRMPRQAITSPSITLPSPPPAPAQKPETTLKRTTEIKSIPSVPPDNRKNLKISETKLPEATSRPPELEAAEKKSPATIEKKSLTPPTVTEKVAAAAPTGPIPSTTGTDSKPAASERKATIVRRQPPAAKPVKIREVQTPAATIPTTTGRKPAIDKQPTTTKQSTMVKPPAAGKTAATPEKKSYVIQAGIFIFPDTLKHYQQILKDHGYTSFVTTRKRSLPMHRVFLGPYANLTSARKIIGNISKWGDDPFPCRRGNKFYINVGSFYYQKTAREKISQYRSRGFAPVVFHEPVSIPHHILLVDGFSFNHYPRNALHSIKQLGIPDAFVRNRQP